MAYVRKAAGITIIIMAGVVAWLLLRPDPEPNLVKPAVDSVALAEVIVPESLSARARAGERIFGENCVTCHGINAAGKDGIGPPLVHIFYEPSHHGDEAIQRAVAVGVMSHHWSFGDMAPIEGLTRSDVELVIAYIRELQRANGIR